MHSDEQPKSIGSFLGPNIRESIAEHRRRMEADPEYRAAQEAEAKARQAEEDRAYEDFRRRSALEATRNRRVKAGIPERPMRFLDAPDPTAAVKAAREFIAGPETLLVLTGGEGPGKTVAACVALDEYTQAVKRYNPHYGPEFFHGHLFKALDLVRAGTFDQEFWDSLVSWDLLVIDDLGTEPLDEKGWALANIHGLLDKRYDAERKTIITANLPWERFAARYCQDGGRLLGRLREVGAFLELDGGSLRKPKAEATATPVRHWQETERDS